MNQGRKNTVSLMTLVVALLITASVSWAAGGYQYNLACSGCHGMPPLDDSSRNPATGGFNGNHQTHMGNPAAVAKCDICHSGTTNPSAFTSGHSNGQIQMFAKYTKGTFFNQTSVPNLTTATCSTVNCHFESISPAWGATPLAGGPNDCNICHAFPPATGQSGTAHTLHTSYLQAYGQFSVCDNCHGDHRFEAKPFQHATSAAWGRPIYTLPVIKYTGAATKYLPSQAGQQVFGKCSNMYCHSNGNPAPATQGYTTVAYRMYSTPVFGTTGNGCGICHAAAPTTNAHSLHVVTKGYGCVLCHSTTVSNNTTILNKALHGNNIKNVAFSGMAGTGSTCSTSACHASTTGTATAPVWTAQNSAACGSCHFATNATMATKAHAAHLNSATLYGPTTLQGTAAAASCQTCHTTYATNALTHVNGVVDTTFTACTPCHVGTLTATIWGAGRVTCESCHSGATRSVIQGVTAPDETLSSSKGHTQAAFTGIPTCNSCHDSTSAHISGVLGDNVRLTLANTNVQCASCHNVAGKTIARFQNMSTHFSTKGGTQDMLCKSCHNPHGSSNLSMIRTQLKGSWTNATTYTILYTDAVNGFVNTTTNRGLCQVCHTKTNHYKAGVAETGHPTSGCLDCHGHNAKGGAFKPSGNCDSCHGYPPMPKGYAVSGVDFGVTGKYASGRFEDYTGGGGAHAVVAHVNPAALPSDGWKNCAVCHNAGNTASTPNHRMLTPVKTNIANVYVSLDQKLRFNSTVQSVYSSEKLVYPGNKTGTCNNVDCHFKPSPRWSILR